MKFRLFNKKLARYLIFSVVLRLYKRNQQMKWDRLWYLVVGGARRQVISAARWLSVRLLVVCGKRLQPDYTFWHRTSTVYFGSKSYILILLPLFRTCHSVYIKKQLDIVWFDSCGVILLHVRREKRACWEITIWKGVYRAFNGMIVNTDQIEQCDWNWEVCELVRDYLYLWPC